MNYTLKLPDGYEKPDLPRGKEWIEALRSGKYEQGKRFLSLDGMYCCLGVLCEVQGILLEEQRRSNKTLSCMNPLIRVLRSDGQFPKGVTVADQNGFGLEMLTNLNDGGFTFSEIADIIEQIWNPL